MEIINRAGQVEKLDVKLVEIRIHTLAIQLPALDLDEMQVDRVILETIGSIHNRITTRELDQFAATTAMRYVPMNPNYEQLAVRLLVSDLQKTVGATFAGAYLAMAKGGHYAGLSGTADPVMSRFVAKHQAALDAMIRPERDNDHSYVAFLSLQKSYLKSHRNAAGAQVMQETIQHCYMRAAVAGWYSRQDMSDEDKLTNIEMGYDLLSRKVICHATPTLFNAGIADSNLAPCFLIGARDDSEWITKSGIADTGLISRACGGIGFHMSNIRPAGTPIKSSGRMSTGLLPQLEIYDRMLACFNQGQKRNGSAKIWLEVWHGDIERVLAEICEFSSTERESRISNLFFGMWIPDLYMRRLKMAGQWSLFSSTNAPELAHVYDGMPVCTQCNWCRNPDYRRAMVNDQVIAALGKSARPSPAHPECQTCDIRPTPVFTRLYTAYEAAGLAIKTFPAEKLLTMISDARRQKGYPDCAFKDATARCSTQDHLGTPTGLNLCAEIRQITTPDEYSTCVLSSINAGRCIMGGAIDWPLFCSAARYLVSYLDGIIDITTPPVPKCRDNICKWRNIGIGLQGVFNAMVACDIPYASAGATQLDTHLYETLYWICLDQSANLAKKYGVAYPRDHSPYSSGEFQPDMWRVNHAQLPQSRGASLLASQVPNPVITPEMQADIRARVIQFGARNIDVTAQMPTTSTSVISGGVESNIAPYALIGSVDTIYGRHATYLPELSSRLYAEGCWNPVVIRAITENDGQITQPMIDQLTVSGHPYEAMALTKFMPLFPTVWQIDQFHLMERAAIRGQFICQSQSMNLYLTSNSYGNMKKTLFHAWHCGLKTGVYYTRTRAAAKTLPVEVQKICSLASGDCCSG